MSDFIRRCVSALSTAFTALLKLPIKLVLQHFSAVKTPPLLNVCFDPKIFLIFSKLMQLLLNIDAYNMFNRL